MNGSKKYIVSCGGFGAGINPADSKKVFLEHRKGYPNYNTRIKLDKFVDSVLTVKNRYKDLLNIAGYLFAADRKIRRGTIDSQEYHAWSRHIVLHIGVIDYSFWNQREIKELLSGALEFMTGDKKYEFVFYQADENFPSSIFDNENFSMEPEENIKILLFSGGIDSLAGAVESLESENNHLCLVSHQSGQKTTMSIQKKLYGSLQVLYPGRLSHYKFECGLSNESSADESQRTRSFLYSAAAFVTAKTYGQQKIHLYENGITSINFAQTQDQMNARSSRTTHPKTLALLENLLSAVADEPFFIENNFFYKTKSDVVNILKKYNRLSLLDTSISCSSTRDNTTSTTHCGKCSQCIDRRFAVFSAEVDEWDNNGIYDFDFLKDSLTDDLTLKMLVEYICMAQNFKSFSLDGFYIEYGPEITDLISYIKGNGDEEKIVDIYELCLKHSDQVEHAINRMQMKYDKPLAPVKPRSFFTLIIRPRAYQKTIPIRIKNELLDDRFQEDNNKDRELENAHNIIKRQKKRINILEQGLTKGELLKLIDNNCRKKNGKINYSALGRRLGCSNHSAKSKCEYFGIN